MSNNSYTIEQQSAIDKKNANILVAASAGSGKTKVLVERVIQKVINEQIDIDKILVVTFTNASAVELKERLLNAIYKELDRDKDNAFLIRQINNMNRASITTIHSFCLEIIRSNFEIINLDPNFKICDESTSLILRNNAITLVLENEYIKYNENKDSSMLFNLLELFSGKDEVIIDIVLKIYSYMQSFAYPMEWLKENIDKYSICLDIDLNETEFGKEIFNNSIKKVNMLSKRAKTMFEKIVGNTDFEKYCQMLDADILNLTNCINLHNNSWDRLYELLNNIEFSRVPIYKGANIELKDSVINFRNDILKESVKELKKSIYAKSYDILKDNKNAYEYLTYIYDIIEQFDNEYKKAKDNIGVIDFNDIEHLSLNLLLEKNDNEIKYSDVCLNLQQRFIEVYTDEYQDTSFVQEAILEAVSASKNRFMVGDIKQSIYRFRQAMPEIFNKKYMEYDSHEQNPDSENCKIVLAKNFRSREEVLSSINYIFEKIMSLDMGDCDYQGTEILKHGAMYYKNLDTNNYKTDIHIIDLKENECSDLEDENLENIENIKELKDFEIEAIYIAKNIKELMSNFKTYSVENDSFKPLEYKEIVILMRNLKEKGKILEKTLKEYGIPAYCDASASLFESEEIKLVLAFLRVLDNVYQDVYLTSIMYSVIGDFNLDELEYIRRYNKNISMYECIIETIKELEIFIDGNNDTNGGKILLLQKLKEFINLIELFTRYSKLYKVSELLIRLYKDTNMYNQYSLEELSSMKKANLDMLIQVAINIENQTQYSLRGYINYVDNLTNKSDTSTSTAKILGENENVVRIMTIHKSKGLEFEVVILCDTSRKYNNLDSKLPINLHHSLGIGINILNDNYNITYPSVIKQSIKSISTKEMRSEELRMLYVALTRAKEKLIIFATTKDLEKKLNNQFIMTNENGKIDEMIILDNSSYFDNILVTLGLKDSVNEYFNICKHFALDNFGADILVENLNQKNTLSLEEKLGEVGGTALEVDNDILEVISRIDKEYDFSDEVNTVQRVSVSELKNANQDEDNLVINKNMEFTMPECISPDGKMYTAVRKGTLVHFILQILDFNVVYDKGSLDKYIEKLLKDGVINKEDFLNIDMGSIYSFINSNIFKEMKLAKYIYKEEEFVLKDEKINKGYIQGVIDLFYINNLGDIILVDFKTDRLDNELEFRDRYYKQLYIYKEAIEKLLNKEVKSTYIYSFYLNKEIGV